MADNFYHRLRGCWAFSTNHFPQERTLSRHSPVVWSLKICLNPLQTQTDQEIEIIPAFVVDMMSELSFRSPGGTTEELRAVALLVSSVMPKFCAGMTKKYNNMYNDLQTSNCTIK